jgi:hypothetical protein
VRALSGGQAEFAELVPARAIGDPLAGRRRGQLLDVGPLEDGHGDHQQEEESHVRMLANERVFVNPPVAREGGSRGNRIE